VYDLVASAGAFSADRAVGTVADEIGWLPVPAHVRLTRDHFVARVSGRSMEPTIRHGSYALFRTDRGGSREGKLVLVWHRGCTDPTLGGEFSIKVPVLLPPISEQQRFRVRLNAAQQLVREMRHASALVSKTMAVVLQRSFTGEITARWRGAHAAELSEEAQQQETLLGEAREQC
jgi:Peptidase S24-like